MSRYMILYIYIIYIIYYLCVLDTYIDSVHLEQLAQLG